VTDIRESSGTWMTLRELALGLTPPPESQASEVRASDAKDLVRPGLDRTITFEGRTISVRDIEEFGYPRFPLVSTAEEFVTLLELEAKARGSKSERRQLQRFVDQKIGKARARIRKFVGLTRGRPNDPVKLSLWMHAAALRAEDPKMSWNKLARLDPDYGRDPRGAADRIRHGVRCIRRKKGK